MNKKLIEKLAVESLVVSDGELIFSKEKFVQLIVRECAGINYNSSFQDGEFHAREVLEHFGVE